VWTRGEPHRLEANEMRDEDKSAPCWSGRGRSWRQRGCPSQESYHYRAKPAAVFPSLPFFFVLWPWIPESCSATGRRHRGIARFMKWCCALGTCSVPRWWNVEPATILPLPANNFSDRVSHFTCRLHSKPFVEQFIWQLYIFSWSMRDYPYWLYIKKKRSICIQPGKNKKE
jgi:hypothetical protein